MPNKSPPPLLTWLFVVPKLVQRALENLLELLVVLSVGQAVLQVQAVFPLAYQALIDVQPAGEVLLGKAVLLTKPFK